MLKRVKSILTNQYFLILLILSLGLVVRLYKLDNPIADWHSWRQADTVSVSRIYLQEGINVLFPRYYDISSIQTGTFNPEGLRLVEFPIFNVANAYLAKVAPIKYPDILLSKSWKAIGYSPSSVELWGRLLSIASSLFSVLFLFLIGKNIYNKSVGLLAALFFAIIPYNIYFSRVILPEPMSVAFGLAGLWAYVKFIKADNKWMLYLSGVMFAVSLLIKPFSAFYLLPALYLTISKFGFREIFKSSKLFIRLLVFVNLALVPFFVWRVWINYNPIGIPHFSWAFNGDNIRFRPAFWRWIFAERFGNLILGVWGLVPVAFGIVAKTGKKYSYFSHYFLLAIVLYVTVFATASVRHDYYQTFVVPAIALALAVGTYAMWESEVFNKLLVRGLLLFSIFVMLVAGWVQVKEFYRVNHPEIVVAGMALDRVAERNASVIASYTGDTAFLYQTNRYGWPVVDAGIDNVLARGADYFVSVNFADPDVAILSAKYETVEKTSQYIIINLRKPLANPVPAN